MPDPQVSDPITLSITGSIGSLMGACVVAMNDKMSRKEIIATIVGALMFGCFIPPALTEYYRLNWGLSGLIGVVVGLTSIGIITGIRMIGAKFGANPARFIPSQVIKDALKDDSPKGGSS